MNIEPELMKGVWSMKKDFYDLNRGEAWLTPFQKSVWRKRVGIVKDWFESRGVEITPWLQIRMRELVLLSFVVERLEKECSFFYGSVSSESEGSSRNGSNAIALQQLELLFKYLERLRKLAHELEGLGMQTGKAIPSFNLVECVQQLMECARELDQCVAIHANRQDSEKEHIANPPEEEFDVDTSSVAEGLERSLAVC